MQISIRILEASSPLLEKIIELGDANNSTLGFLPHAAFENHANQGNILVAVDPHEQFLGYLLFRIVKTKQIVSITHLCVDEKFRGYGIARKLVEQLKSESKDWRGISLFSRRDYKTNSFWEHMGFVAKWEKTGRGKDKMPLTYYWYDNKHPDLFSLANNQQIQSKLAHAVIDANVVYTLHENSNHPLLADWLIHDVFLCITPEMRNEINRQQDASKRRLMWNYVNNNFPEINFDWKKFNSILDLVRSNSILDTSRPQHESDIRQISFAIAGNAEFFITQDEQLISNFSDRLLSEFSMKIVRPDDLIIHLDELMNSAKYQQNRFAGSLLKINRVSSGQSDLLAQTFQVQKLEKKSHFAIQLRTFLAEPNKFETNIVTTPSDDLLALIVINLNDEENVLEIPIIRVVEKLNLSALASHLIFREIQNSVKAKKRLVKITDPYLTDDVIQGLSENSFTFQDGSWIKANLPENLCVKELESNLKKLKGIPSNLANMCSNLIQNLLVERKRSDS